MFKRLILEDYAAVFTIVAFLTAVTIYASITWRALRMPRRQLDELANLPFTPDSADTSHDTRA